MSGLRLVVIFIVSTYAATVVPVGDVKQVGLKVIRPVTLNYFLLARKTPAEFRVTEIPDSGIWVRVYSRLWFNRNIKPNTKGSYVLIFMQGDSVQRFHLQTEVSGSSAGPAGQPVGKWRSFYVHLLPGVQHFHLALDSASADTVAVRFRLQPPRDWEQVIIPGAPQLTVISRTESTEVGKNGYVRLKTGVPFSFTISGPGRVRLKVRIDYDPGMSGVQNYLVEVSENDSVLIRRTLRAAQDKKARYLEDGRVIPGVERYLSFDLSAGAHRLAVVIKGTLAKSGSMAIDRLSAEKYE
ncbi:MAG: hypothetical protein ACPL0F_00745 [bacterium]|jgi:hypothetical protein